MAKDIIEDFKKQGNITLASDFPEDEYISTGLPSLDYILGGYGVPKGKHLEIHGGPESGKSTLAYSLIAQIQKTNKLAVIADVEGRFDKKYAKLRGVDLSNLEVIDTLSAEDYLDVIEAFVRTGDVGIVVVDSVAALSTISELEKRMEENTVGATARLLGKALRKVVDAVKKSNCILVWVNQERIDIGKMFGDKSVTPGGKAIRFFTTTALKLTKIETIKTTDDIIGYKILVKITKGRSCTGKTTKFDMIYNQGIDFKSDLIEVLIGMGKIKQGNNIMFNFKEKSYRGRKSLKEIPDEELWTALKED